MCHYHYYSVSFCRFLAKLSRRYQGPGENLNRQAAITTGLVSRDEFTTTGNVTSRPYDRAFLQVAMWTTFQP